MQIWVRDGAGNILLILGELKLTSEIKDGKMIVTAKYPVLYRCPIKPELDRVIEAEQLSEVSDDEEEETNEDL